MSDALHSVLYLWDVSIWYSIWIPVSATGGSRQAETCSVCKCQVGRVFFPQNPKGVITLTGNMWRSGYILQTTLLVNPNL